MVNPMRRIGLHRQIAALDFVLALGASLDAGNAMGNGEIDRLIIAEFEMQEGHLHGRPPIAAIERILAPKVERAGHRLAIALGQHQHHPLAQALAQQAPEAAM